MDIKNLRDFEQSYFAHNALPMLEPPRPDPALVPQSVHGNYPVPIAPDDPPGWTPLGYDAGPMFHFGWRHVAFFFVTVACIGLALMIVYGGAR